MNPKKQVPRGQLSQTPSLLQCGLLRFSKRVNFVSIYLFKKLVERDDTPEDHALEAFESTKLFPGDLIFAFFKIENQTDASHCRLTHLFQRVGT